MNLKELKDLIELLGDTDIEEIEIEKSGSKIRIKRWMPNVVRETAKKEPEIGIELQGVGIKQEAKETSVVEKIITVTSPIVGTFYRASAPEAKPYVEEGNTVRKGQILCIIEAMKLMNEIESEYDGKIVKVLVENGHPVEYGEPLFLIEPV